MSQAVVGKWGKNLAIRVPFEVARESGLSDGERVDSAIDQLGHQLSERHPIERLQIHAIQPAVLPQRHDRVRCALAGADRDHQPQRVAHRELLHQHGRRVIL